eukprot:6103587-Amphidinium_carterae.1
MGEMTRSEGVAIPITDGSLSDPERQRSSTLYYLLAMLLEGRAQTMLTNTPTGQGYELWRRLVREYEPRTGSRSASLLVQILSFAFDSSDLADSLE